MKRNFTDFIEAYLDYSSGHEATTKIHLWTVLSVLAGAMERKVWMNRGYYTLFPNLYIFIIGRSGLIKKSTSTSIGIDLLKEVPDIKFMSERLTAASLIDQMHNARKKFEIGAQQISQSPLYAYASELLVLMNEVYGQTTELLTTFYDCQPNDPKKPWVYKARHQDAVKIFGPCLNILGASTEAWLKKCIPVSEMEGGFTARAVFVVENKGPDKFVAWPEYSERRAAMKTKLIEDLIWINDLKGEVKIHPQMKQDFTDWYQYHMKEVVTPNTDGRFTGYLARKGDLLLKLSMIRSVSKRDDLYILPSHFEWAGQVLESVEEGMFNAFDLGAEKAEKYNPSVAIISNFNVQDFIKSKGKASKEEIRAHFNVKKNGGPLADSLRNLVEMGTVDIESDNETQYFVYKDYAEKMAEETLP